MGRQEAQGLADGVQVIQIDSVQLCRRWFPPLGKSRKAAIENTDGADPNTELSAHIQVMAAHESTTSDSVTDDGPSAAYRIGRRKSLARADSNASSIQRTTSAQSVVADGPGRVARVQKR